MRINLEQKTLDIELRDSNYILIAYIRSYLHYSKNIDPDRIVFPMFASAPHPYKPGVEIPIEYVSLTDPMTIEIAIDGNNVLEATEEQIAQADTKDMEIRKLKTEIEELRNTIETSYRGEGVRQHIGEGQRSGESEGQHSVMQQSEGVRMGPAEQREGQHITREHPEKDNEKQSQLPTSAARKVVPALPDRVPRMPEGGDIGPGNSPDNMGSRNSRADRQLKRDLLEDADLDVDETKEKPFDKTIRRDELGRPVVE